METKNEIWKDIEGYEGLYQISNLGRIRSLDHYVKQPNPHNGLMQDVLRRGCLLKPSYCNSGYLHVALSSGNRKYKSFMIHRLVAIHFIDNPKGYREVNHKNEDKTDNRSDNLEWCSRRYNVYYGNKSKSRHVIQMDQEGKTIAKYRSTKDAARILGLNPSSIASVCRGLFKQTGGYRWRYSR